MIEQRPRFDIILARDVDEGAKLAYMAMVNHADAAGFCEVTAAVLASDMGVSVSTIRRRLDQLLIAGYVRIYDCTSGGMNRYQLAIRRGEFVTTLVTRENGHKRVGYSPPFNEEESADYPTHAGNISQVTTLLTVSAGDLPTTDARAGACLNPFLATSLPVEPGNPDSRSKADNGSLPGVQTPGNTPGEVTYALTGREYISPDNQRIVTVTAGLPAEDDSSPGGRIDPEPSRAREDRRTKLDRAWERTLEELAPHIKPTGRVLVRKARLAEVRGNQATVTYAEKGAEIFMQAVQPRLTDAMSRAFGRPIAVEVKRVPRAPP